MKSELETLIEKYRELGIDRQLDYDKFHLYSIITHSTAIEGSTLTELENQIMFDNGISLKGKSLIEQHMNLDLKAAYERMLTYARDHADVTIDRLKRDIATYLKSIEEDSPIKNTLAAMQEARHPEKLETLDLSDFNDYVASL